MRIRIMDKVFAVKGLGAAVKESVPKPRSRSIAISRAVSVWHETKKEAGTLQLFQNCLKEFGRATEEKRLKQYAKGLFYSFKLLKGSLNEESLQQMSEQVLDVRQKSAVYDAIYKRIFEIIDATAPNLAEIKRVEIPDAEEWLTTQKLTLRQIVKLCEDMGALQEMNQMVQHFSSRYEKKNILTTRDGTEVHVKKTLYGVPYDQNRLGKVGAAYVPGFENFYIAGSEIKMPYRTYDIMQAPLLQSKRKVETIKDFWDTVVAMRKSPIIVTTHDPREKIAKHGSLERAEYWTYDRFKHPMELRNGWQVLRVGDDEVIAQSKNSAEIRLVKRTFVAKNTSQNVEHTITQFHIQGWPDHHGAPDHLLLDQVHQAIDKETKERKLSLDLPITSHCAAGMGRSPLFAVANHLRFELLSRIEKGENIDEMQLEVAKTIYEFKKQRPALMTGDEQWLSLFLSLRRVYLQIKGVPNEEIRPLELKLERQILKKPLS